MVNATQNRSALDDDDNDDGDDDDGDDDDDDYITLPQEEPTQAAA